MVTQTSAPGPRRGEIWWARLDPTEGREQAGRRPVLIISATTFNQGPRELVVILPITRRRRSSLGYPLHVEIAPAESGLPDASFVMVEQIRAVSTARLHGGSAVGMLSQATLTEIQDRLIALLDIDRP